MYYIVNLDNQVVAADSDFLSLLKIDHLQGLFTQLINSKLKFNELGNGTLEIATGINTITLTQNRYPLTTLMGDLVLIELSEIKEAVPSPVDLPEATNDQVKFLVDEEEESDNDITPLPDEKIDFLKPIEEDSVEEEEILDLLPKEDIDDKIDLLPDEESEIVFLTDEKEDDSASNNDINLLPDEEIDFLKPTEKEEVKEDEAAEEENEEYLAPSDESIFIDTEKNSKILGISKEDYSEFLDEFIDKAIEQEEAVKDIESTEHHKATLSLYKLAQMLHLSTLSEILEKAEGASGEKEKRAIEAFYLTLSNLTTLETEPDDTVSELEEEVYDNQICILTLDDIKPIHFDFQLEKASEDLSLPVDLIEEFVNDFIIQAHEEKINFMDACKKGDIDEIHRIGHKLKGVASNLRINPLADTLEEIQFCEDRSRFEPLLKKYWGQFLAFELYMHQISHHEGSN